MLNTYKKFNRSIKFKLISAIIITFVLIISLYNIIINMYTSYVFKELYRSVEKNPTDKVGDIYLFVDSTIFNSNIELKVFSIFVLTIMIIVGCIVLYFIIKNVMNPLEKLTHQLSKIDINNIESLNARIHIENAGYELERVTEAFNTTIGKIFSDYEKQKSFNANVAHELRTPLSILRTKIDVFRKKSRSVEEYEELISILYENIEKITEMVNKIIMLSKDYNNVPCKNVCINDIVEEVLLDLENRANQKNISLSVVGDELYLNSNEILFGRIIFNLVENAIKYNNEGGFVEVSIYRDVENVVVEVKDDGFGIDDSEKENVFDVFFRSGKSKGRIDGSGIGLSVVKTMVESLDGEVDVYDNIPEGSIFRVKFKDFANS